MSYYVESIESTLRIPVSEERKALLALKDWANQNKPYYVDVETILDAEYITGALAACNYSAYFDDDYYIIINNFERHNWDSDTNEGLMDALAPFMVHDSYIIFLGEDNSFWKYLFTEEGRQEHMSNISEIDKMDNTSLKVMTPLGELVVTPTDSCDYPGVVIELIRDGEASDLALIEAHPKDSSEKDVLDIHVWATKEEDFTHKIIFNK